MELLLTLGQERLRQRQYQGLNCGSQARGRAAFLQYPSEDSMDDAAERGRQSILEAAKQLPRTVRFIRNRYPEKFETAEIAKALGMSKEDVRAELNPMFPHRVYKKAGTMHGEVTTAIWQYRLTRD